MTNFKDYFISIFQQIDSLFGGNQVISTVFVTSVLTVVVYVAISILWHCYSQARNKREIELYPMENLKIYNGKDPILPIMIAIRGVVYDVSQGKEFYGPGGPYQIFAGKECARALAIMSTQEEDCTGDIHDCTDEQLATLDNWVAKIKKKYPVIGKTVPDIELTLKELTQHSGTNPQLPLLLAIQGRIFDVSGSRQFYGPDGVYPFAGHEVARAFAKYSTQLDDCTDDLAGLNQEQMDTLGEWITKFELKYPIVGRIVQESRKSVGQQI